MYISEQISQPDDETFIWNIPTDWNFRILQITDLQAMAFFHMPLREFKEAYEKMKLGDRAVVYRHGSIGEKEEFFGISRFESPFFESAVRNGVIRWMSAWYRRPGWCQRG